MHWVLFFSKEKILPLHYELFQGIVVKIVTERPTARKSSARVDIPQEVRVQFPPLDKERKGDKKG